MSLKPSENIPKGMLRYESKSTIIFVDEELDSLLCHEKGKSLLHGWSSKSVDVLRVGAKETSEAYVISSKIRQGSLDKGIGKFTCLENQVNFKICQPSPKLALEEPFKNAKSLPAVIYSEDAASSLSNDKTIIYLTMPTPLTEKNSISLPDIRSQYKPSSSSHSFMWHGWLMDKLKFSAALNFAQSTKDQYLSVWNIFILWEDLDGKPRVWERINNITELKADRYIECETNAILKGDIQTYKVKDLISGWVTGNDTPLDEKLIQNFGAEFSKAYLDKRVIEL